MPATNFRCPRMGIAIGTALLLAIAPASAQPLPAGHPAGSSKAAIDGHAVHVILAPILIGPLIWWAIFGGDHTPTSTSSPKK